MRKIGGGIALVLCFSLSACGGSGGPVDLSVNPESSSVTAGDPALAVTATLINATDTIRWSLNGKGSLSATTGTAVSYTAPASLVTGDTATIIASAAGETAFATININPNVTLTVSPPARTVKAGSTGVVFNATLTNSDATILWVVTKGPGSWTLTGPTSTYFPPASVTAPQTATITAFADGLTAEATITVNP